MTKEQKKAIAIAKAKLKLQRSGVSPETEQFSGRLPLDDLAYRGQILPIGRTQDDEFTFAVPQMAVDIAESAMMPGRVMSGQAQDLTMQDLTEAALTFGTPALRGISGTGTKQVPGKLTRKMIKESPTTKQLKARGSDLFEKAKGATAIIRPDSYQNALIKIEDDIFSAGFDAGLHPKAAAALNAISKRLGKELDMQELMNIRRLTANAANSIDADEARIGSRMVAQIDDYVRGLGADDLVSGAMEGAAKNLDAARKLWTQMSKAADIDDVFRYAKDQASGFENGLRIGFRALLKKRGAEKRFSMSELSAMRDVVAGNFTRNTLKRLGKLGPGTGQQTNILGGMMGSGGGGVIGTAFGGPVGGIVGAVGVPTLGYGAQKLGERGTRLAAERARALAAGVRATPRQVPVGTQGVPRALLGQVPSTIGRMQTDEEREEWIRNQQFLAAGGA